MATWLMLVADGSGRRVGVYSVTAETDTEACEKIETELTPKRNRQSILARWRAEGRPVRRVHTRQAAALADEDLGLD